MSMTNLRDPRSDEPVAPLMFWMMLIKGPFLWRYVRAEAPCWKGEIDLSFRWFHLVIGWQRVSTEHSA